MRRLLFCVLVLCATAAAQVQTAEYAERGARLMAARPDGLIVIYARSDFPAYAEGGFRQDNDLWSRPAMESLLRPLQQVEEFVCGESGFFDNCLQE